MSNKRAPGRSLDEWMDLVTECRQSGLTDAAWCKEHGIPPSCFYNAVARLRKKACQIPDPVAKASTLDLASHKRDVVQIAIEPEPSPAEPIPDNGSSSVHLDNSHTIEIQADGLLIRMSNEIIPVLLKILMDTRKESLCWRISQMLMRFISSVAEQICVSPLMDYVRSSRNSFRWRPTMHSFFSAVANVTGSKPF